ncbi:MAG: threonylcarbamoyl-AMP synthase [Firmicutes bacterium HGW-Firmicutes-13]|nr:MAG: threonylcarbamoyl-AMP synthase [Firmicutes bacterium HGW-Firmicutes-13]
MWRKVKGTIVIKAEKIEEASEGINLAGKVIQKGGLVAFPTETVYGLGANAFSAAAVRKIFLVKGRPEDNPLIVHIAEVETLKQLAAHIPSQAWELAERFWPGPLTMVFKKKPLIPPETTAGLDTMAVRIPRHAAALALIKSAGLPLAAPSANLSGRPSPTTAEHVLEDLAGRVEVLLDGGPCVVGLESTVLDMSGEKPILLRPGGVTLEELQDVLGEVEIASSLEEGQKPSSPGMKYQHYAPRVPMFLVEGEPVQVIKKIRKLCRENYLKGRKVGLLLTEENKDLYFEAEAVEILGTRQNPKEIAANLFNGLRRLDASGVDLILAESFEERGLGLALMNRLRRAASGRVIKAD